MNLFAINWDAVVLGLKIAAVIALLSFVSDFLVAFFGRGKR